MVFSSIIEKIEGAYKSGKVVFVSNLASAEFLHHRGLNVFVLENILSKFSDPGVKSKNTYKNIKLNERKSDKKISFGYVCSYILEKCKQSDLLFVLSDSGEFKKHENLINDFLLLVNEGITKKKKHEIIKIKEKSLLNEKCKVFENVFEEASYMLKKLRTSKNAVISSSDTTLNTTLLSMDKSLKSFSCQNKYYNSNHCFLLICSAKIKFGKALGLEISEFSATSESNYKGGYLEANEFYKYDQFKEKKTFYEFSEMHLDFMKKNMNYKIPEKIMQIVFFKKPALSDDLSLESKLNLIRNSSVHKKSLGDIVNAYSLKIDQADLNLSVKDLDPSRNSNLSVNDGDYSSENTCRASLSDDCEVYSDVHRVENGSNFLREKIYDMNFNSALFDYIEGLELESKEIDCEMYISILENMLKKIDFDARVDRSNFDIVPLESVPFLKDKTEIIVGGICSADLEQCSLLTNVNLNSKISLSSYGNNANSSLNVASFDKVTKSKKGKLHKPKDKYTDKEIDFSYMPKTFSISEISKLCIDPYSFYVKSVLGLIEKHYSFLNIVGMSVHKALENYAKNLNKEECEQIISESGLSNWGNLIAGQKIKKMLYYIDRFFLNLKTSNQEYEIFTEKESYLNIEMENEIYKIYGRIDFVYRLSNGSCGVVEYKTGSVPSISSVLRGEMPQIIYELAMLNNIDFSGHVNEIGDSGFMSPKGFLPFTYVHFVPEAIESTKKLLDRFLIKDRVFFSTKSNENYKLKNLMRDYS
ncbi:PD-(D/E)XK nuclease family protein [Candidatus Nesciobacter abundans]|uniref:PD-(D/E)XK nuclease family protein n=1 Tax=Candidatus Nesciobacter abundans TaxID=2601668 RepID=A0A5C0UFU5_9PROT|nr:PD-(D/E)XK nuclease family protein [Candidatus Nesciobacter abundans]QEK38965.1 PD-(D/E)XK nuclease family protein [Candidatus Nesciobacter abundans]